MPFIRPRSKPRPGRLKGRAMEKLREDVFARDGFLCQHEFPATHIICKNPVKWETGELAHRRNRRMWGDSPENTYCCCKDCHRMYHQRGPSMEKICPAK